MKILPSRPFVRLGSLLLCASITPPNKPYVIENMDKMRDETSSPLL